MLDKLLNTALGKIILSIILGLGLASLFRQVCKGGNCIIIKGPPITETSKYYYKVDDDCFKYTPVATECPTESES